MFNSYNAGYYGTVYQSGRGYTRIAPLPDEDIQGRIYDALDNDLRISKIAEIRVTVDRGIVTLTGNAPSDDTKRAAEGCVRSIPQVRDVNNQLRIVRRDPPRRSHSSPWP